MNLGQLRTQTREIIRDTLLPPFFADATLNAYLNEAERESCLRAKLLYDASFAITLVAGQALYDVAGSPLGARFFLLDRFMLGGLNTYRTLLPSTIHQMDSRRPGWEESSPGLPEFVLLDQVPHKLRIWPTPSVEANGLPVRLRGFRLPINDMLSDADTPEIAVIWHEYLTDWALYRCYATRDFDTYDPALSAQHLKLFEQRFGVRPSAELSTLLARREYVPIIPRMVFGGG